jgi:hypothetical protein
MKKDPARSTKKNVKGKKPTKVCTEKNCPKNKKAKKSSCKSQSAEVQTQTIPVETVVTTVTLLDKVVGQFKEVFGWVKK